MTLSAMAVCIRSLTWMLLWHSSPYNDNASLLWPDLSNLQLNRVCSLLLQTLALPPLIFFPGFWRLPRGVATGNHLPLSNPFSYHPQKIIYFSLKTACMQHVKRFIENPFKIEENIFFFCVVDFKFRSWEKRFWDSVGMSSCISD